MPRLQSPRRLASLAGVLAAVVVAGADAPRAAAMPATPDADLQGTAQRVNPNAKAIAEFQEEVAEYVELHRKLERTLPSLAKDASTEAIDQHQRALGTTDPAGPEERRRGRHLRTRRAPRAATAAAWPVRRPRRHESAQGHHGREPSRRGREARRQRTIPRHGPALEHAAADPPGAAATARGARLPVHRDRRSSCSTCTRTSSSTI